MREQVRRAVVGGVREAATVVLGVITDRVWGNDYWDFVLCEIRRQVFVHIASVEGLLALRRAAPSSCLTMPTSNDKLARGLFDVGGVSVG